MSAENTNTSAAGANRSAAITDHPTAETPEGHHDPEVSPTSAENIAPILGIDDGTNATSTPATPDRSTTNSVTFSEKVEVHNRPTTPVASLEDLTAQDGINEALHKAGLENVDIEELLAQDDETIEPPPPQVHEDDFEILKQAFSKVTEFLASDRRPYYGNHWVLVAMMMRDLGTKIYPAQSVKSAHELIAATVSVHITF